MASDRPEAEDEQLEEVIEEVEEAEEGIVSPELMIKHPLQVGHGRGTWPLGISNMTFTDVTVPLGSNFVCSVILVI